MIATGRVAYANARVRALKAHLLDRDTLRRRQTGPVGQLLALDAGETIELAELARRRFRRLVECYAVILASYPSGHELVHALFRLHEIENVKLVWRARVRLHRVERWQLLWRPLRDLETVRFEDAREQTTLPDFVAGLRRTPYATIAQSTLRAHLDDLAASELALDRWASISLLRAATRLRRGEAAARDLAIAIVRERDLNLLRRGAGAFRLSPDAVVGSLALLPSELPPAELGRLATWKAEDGPIFRGWPRRWPRIAGTPGDWDQLFGAIRRARRDLCRRAFLGSPYCLAPAISLLLLQEEEVRSAVAVQESGGFAYDNAAGERVLAASAMGA